VTRRWRIRHKLGAGLLLVVGMTAMLSGGAFYGLYSYRHSNKTFEHHRRQLELLGNLTIAIADLRTPPSPESEAVTPRLELQLGRLNIIDESVARFRASLERAVSGGIEAGDVSRQFAELDLLNALVAAVRSEAKGDSLNGDPAHERNFFLTPRVNQHFIDVHDALRRLAGHLHLSVQTHVEVDRANYRTSMGIVYSTSVLVVALLCVLVWLGYRAIFHPIRALHRSVVKLAARQFDSRVKLDSGDEMQELGESFNDMADKLQAVYRDLNRQVEDRSRQLIRSERLASVGFLAAGVAHEINNPLASIAFCAEALQSRLEGELAKDSPQAEVAANYLKMIEEEAFRCKAITEKLLNFSRAGAPERSETDVVTLIREVLAMIETLGRARGKNIVFEPDDVVYCTANPQELKQVLLNLVVNALESVDDGGTVTLSAKSERGRVEIRVADDGCGMTPEVLENLFEPFFTRSRTGKGTGLGLSISHLIVSQHGGSLEAESDGPGRGSTFVVKLPARAAAAIAA
jgi:two-component system NtrC family sensor kinase